MNSKCWTLDEMRAVVAPQAQSRPPREAPTGNASAPPGHAAMLTAYLIDGLNTR
jgi:hypothetical protein